jgi:hypothetical protein
MKTWESGGIAPPLFTSSVDGNEWSVSRFGCFTLRRNHPLYLSHIRLDGPRLDVDVVEKRKIDQVQISIFLYLRNVSFHPS